MNQSNCRGSLKYFSGAKTLDLELYMKPSLNNNQPNAAALKIESNDVDFRNLRSETAIKVALLCKGYGVSEVVVFLISSKRNIKLSKLIRQVNDIRKMNVYFLSNDNISRNFICDNGMHLNQQGTHILANNFVAFINIFNSN